MMSKRSLLPLLGLAVLSGYLVKLYTECREAAAIPPAACKKYDCKTIHAYWPGTPRVCAFHLPVASPAVGGATTSAMSFLFTPASNEILPRIPDGNKVDSICYTACAPLCGIDPGNGKWQATQEVNTAGVVNPNFRVNNGNRLVCTPNNAAAPESENQNNNPDPGEPPLEPISTPL